MVRLCPSLYFRDMRAWLDLRKKWLDLEILLNFWISAIRLKLQPVTSSCATVAHTHQSSCKNPELSANWRCAPPRSNRGKVWDQGQSGRSRKPQECAGFPWPSRPHPPINRSLLAFILFRRLKPPMVYVSLTLHLDSQEQPLLQANTW